MNHVSDYFVKKSVNRIIYQDLFVLFILRFSDLSNDILDIGPVSVWPIR